MKKPIHLLTWWLAISVLWGLYRLLFLPEFFSEVVAKPVIWLGTTLIFLHLGVIPKSVVTNLKKKFLTLFPIWKVILLPSVGVLLYFFLINFKSLQPPAFSFLLIVTTLLINFSTGVVEEIVYRGVMYVWLLQITSELKAFTIVQLLFLLAHLPILLLNSTSMVSGLTHAFFILLLGSIHTIIFRTTKSLYASSISHGIWNSLVYYFLIS